VGLLDYGQTKRLPEGLRHQYARLVLALNEKDELAIAAAFKALGIQTEKAPDVHHFSYMAGLMFDTKMPEDMDALNPFTDGSEIKKNPITVSCGRFWKGCVLIL
jgi:predicted unusual protein kinase regulating ubiquinone biosynthesis (AarF/ABC1/UbiB family)